MRYLDSPCMNCISREQGCHSNCEEYKSYQVDLEKQKSEARKHKQYQKYKQKCFYAVMNHKAMRGLSFKKRCEDMKDYN